MKIVSRIKQDADYVFLDIAKSLCPDCRRTVDAQVVARGGKVYLRKRCPEHGPSEALIFGDADLYLRIQRFNKPGTRPLHFETEVRDGCPRDCGLCPDHQQHACLGIIEVQQECNMACPTCFAGSRPHAGGALTVEQVAFMLDKFVEAEGAPEVVQFSGGEPSLHPQILECIDAAKARGIKIVMLNTNGLRLAKDPAFADALAARQVTLYLQFDGLEARTNRILRGREDLAEVRHAALDAAEARGIDAVLVATLQRGVNEHEIGPILEYARSRPAVVRGVNYQPTTYTGRRPEFDPLDRITNDEVIRLLCDQTTHFRESDFVPVPCCSPGCQFVTYAYQNGDTFLPLPRVLNVEEYLDYISNRATPAISAMTKEALEGLWSATAVAGSEATGRRLSTACCDLDLGALAGLERKMMMVSIISFLDLYTFDVRRVMKCCVAEIVPDGRIIPFCAYNLLHREHPEGRP